MVAAFAWVLLGPPGAGALSTSCEWGPGADEVQLGGLDEERTRTVLGYTPNERIFISTRDIVDGPEFESNCGPAPGGWDFIEADYGALDDHFRLDGKGLAKAFQNPVAASIPVTVNSGGGEDEVRGHPGFDGVDPGFGKDLVITGGGHDELTIDDGQGDTAKAGGGADDVFADDGARDRIDCGSGFDFADADSLDRVAANCEKVD